MDNPPSNACCCRHGPQPPGENRRGFFASIAAVLCGAVGLLVPAVAGLAAFLNPLRQKSQSGTLRKLAAIDMLPEDGTPRRFSVIADRTDAWNYFPNAPIGAVFLRLDPASNKVRAFQVICPHAGCSITYQASPEGGKFFCPCHVASFDLAGDPTDTGSPSPRPMDRLDVEIRNHTEVWVRFENFRTGTATKVALA
jgi:Rieske Fe-S protein